MTEPEKPQFPEGLFEALYFPVSDDAAAEGYMFAESLIGRPELVTRLTQRRIDAGFNNSGLFVTLKVIADELESKMGGSSTECMIGAMYVEKAMAANCRDKNTPAPRVYGYDLEEIVKKIKNEGGDSSKKVSEAMTQATEGEKELEAFRLRLEGKVGEPKAQSVHAGYINCLWLFKEAVRTMTVPKHNIVGIDPLQYKRRGE